MNTENAETENSVMSFDDWYDINEEELWCAAAESGADREFDFDSEEFAEQRYDSYVKGGLQPTKDRISNK